MITAHIFAPEYKNAHWAAGIALGSLLLYQLLFFILKRWSRKKESFLPALLQQYIYVPGLLAIFMIALNAGLLLTRTYLHDTVYNTIRVTLELSLIAAVAFLAMRALSVLREMLLRRHKGKDAEDFSYRKANTKYRLLQQVFNVVIVVLTGVAMVLVFKSGKQLSSELLASAGMVGLVLGFAAQKSLGTLFAGIQVAIAEPIRLDDLVEVEGMFGTITEINLTYVVVHGSDENNLIVPINYFLDSSFKNWTRESPKVMATVKLSVDYSVPIDKIRETCLQWIEESKFWDKRTKSFVVTDTTEKTIELRARMSAANMDDAWDLECLIREKLITYLNAHYPLALPKERRRMEN
jgi:small-conductance mechanosensitive channel